MLRLWRRRAEDRRLVLLRTALSACGLHADNVQSFIHRFAQAFPESLHRLLLDNSGAHTAQRLTLPETVRLVCLPPSCPALNPMARVWRDRKEALAWLQCPTREGQPDDVALLLRADEAATLHGLTASPSLIKAIHALCP